MAYLLLVLTVMLSILGIYRIASVRKHISDILDFNKILELHNKDNKKYKTPEDVYKFAESMISGKRDECDLLDFRGLPRKIRPPIYSDFYHDNKYLFESCKEFTRCTFNNDQCLITAFGPCYAANFTLHSFFRSYFIKKAQLLKKEIENKTIKDE